MTQTFLVKDVHLSEHVTTDVIVVLMGNTFMISLDKGVSFRSIEVERPDETIIEYAHRMYDRPQGN